MSETRFKGKVILVTGASRGIGASAAIAFAKAGATVIGVARSEQSEASSGAKDASGDFFERRFDFGSATRESLAELIAGVVKDHGRIDVLLNNAGTIRRSAAVDFSEQDWDEVLAINLRSPFFLTQAVAKWWIDKGRDKADSKERLRVINIASMLSYQGGIRVVSYTAAKHGIAGITKALANEWADQRINVNAIAPGYIATENTAILRADPVRNKSIRDRIPHGEWGKPDDIAGACLFLASSDADYINGAVLNVDGGWLAR